MRLKGSESSEDMPLTRVLGARAVANHPPRSPVALLRRARGTMGTEIVVTLRIWHSGSRPAW